MSSPMYEVVGYITVYQHGNHGHRGFETGELLYKYLGPTYGCISDDGVAVSEGGSYEPPFFQLPRKSLREVE